MIPKEKEIALNTHSAPEILFVKRLSILIPLCVLASVPFLKSFFSYLVNLQVPKEWMRLGSIFEPKTLIVAAFFSVVPLLWAMCLKAERRFFKIIGHGQPVATIGAVLFVIMVCGLFRWHRVNWFFLEAVKVRAEEFSYPRSAAFWKRQTMDSLRRADNNNLILVGSSQMNFAVDSDLLSSEFANLIPIKKCLPGFGIMQYLMSAPEILSYHPDIVICWISEFDTHREDRIPANRLRYFPDLKQLWYLLQTLQPIDLWKNRSQLADIGFAGIIPLWKERDSMTLLLKNFWWPSSSRLTEKTSNAKDTEIVKQRENLVRSVRRTELVEANFKAFRYFASLMVSKRIKLIVFEGKTNPMVSAAYNPAFREETREQLRLMASEIGFTYVPESEMPRFTPDDYTDAYHLNKSARAQFTTFLVEYINRELE